MRHNNILIKTAARRARPIFFFVLANVIIDTACCMCLPASECTIYGGFDISLCNIKDESILFEKVALKLSDNNIIISALYTCYQLFIIFSSICVEAQQNA